MSLLVFLWEILIVYLSSLNVSTAYIFKNKIRSIRPWIFVPDVYGRKQNWHGTMSFLAIVTWHIPNYSISSSFSHTYRTTIRGLPGTAFHRHTGLRKSPTLICRLHQA